MKKIIAGTLLAAALGLSVVGFAGCDPASTGSADGDKFGSFTSTEQVYGFSAASAATVISAMNGGQAAGLARAKNIAVSTAAEVTDEATIDELNGYMMLVESLLSDGAFGFTESASDVDGYAKMMRVTYRDLTNNTVAYTMYYNETIVEEETEYDDGEEEVETTSRIDGILRVDGTDYPMQGIAESSAEGDETESEHSLTVTLGERSSLRVEQSVEQERGENEQEYAYSLYEDGTLTERSLFEYEQEDDETEIRLEQRVRGEDGSYTTQVFYFDKETERGQELIRIRVGDRNAAATYRVSIQANEDGTTSYVYSYAGGSYECRR